MTCPKCTFDQPDGLEECGRCGVLFARIVAPPPPFSTAVSVATTQTGIAGLDPAASRTLLIGGSMALLFSWTPYLNFVFGYLVTLVHELGHCITGWIFGYPSIPAFDFLHGGGVTIHQNRSLLIVAIVYACLGLAFYHLRTTRVALIALSALTIVYTFAAFTRLHQILQLFMGHGTELIFAGIFLYRALSGEKVRTPAERPLYAFAGFFILLEDIRFAFGLMTNHERRVEYELAKGGGSWMDLSRIAEEFIGTDLTRVAAFLLACCFLPPLVSFLAFRNRDRIRTTVSEALETG